MPDEPAQKKALWKWNKAKHDAAQLLAADEFTDQEIADRVGIIRNTLWVWKKSPEFAARVKELAEQLGDLALRYAIGRRARRLRALEDRWERLKRVIAERASALEMAGAPGGDTGLLCRTLKSIGAGDHAEKVEEYELDAALLKELREHEKQAAIELGQWSEKREHSIPELETLLAAELARLAGASLPDEPAGPTGGVQDPQTDPVPPGQPGPPPPDSHPPLPPGGQEP